MQTTYIKFLNREDRTRGFYELATRARVSSLPGEVYQIPIEALRMLDDRHLHFRRATDIEVKNAQDLISLASPPRPSPIC